MIADRHVLVVRQQRVVGPELLADIGRVMDADIEVGVVADRAPAGASQSEAACRQLSTSWALGSASAEQSDSRRRSARRRRSPRARSALSVSPELACRASARRPGDRLAHSARDRGSVADRRRRPLAPPSRAEDAERKVLDRKVGMAVGTNSPNCASGIVCFVDEGHRRQLRLRKAPSSTRRSPAGARASRSPSGSGG